MKNRNYVLFLTGLVLCAAVFWAGKTLQRDPLVISWFMADVDGDGEEERLTIRRRRPDDRMVLETGEPYGEILEIGSEYSFDLSEIKPLKIQAGDVDGDGKTELAVCVYKTTKFHPSPAKRPFFYALRDGELEPVWLGSRLAHPFADYILFDIDEDRIDEIISIEFAENGNQMIGVYDWRGFGFEMKAVSGELPGGLLFPGDAHHKREEILVESGEKTYGVSLNGEELILLEHLSKP